METNHRPAPDRPLNRRQLLAAAAGLAAFARPGAPGAAPASLPQPVGPVLLTLDTGRAGEPGPVRFDRAMLEALPQEGFVTTTLWTDGPKHFSGPSLRTVLDAAGAPHGRAVTLAALNDYRVELAPEMIEPRVPVLATRINGAPYGVREKGPLWLVWPFDSHDRFRREEIFARSVWQLIAIVVAS